MNDTSKLQNCITCRYGNGFHQKCYACWSDGEGSKTNWTQKETNYERYFGTPEKTIDTIMTIHYVCETDGCAACLYPSYKCNDEDAMLEWLNTEEE